MGFFDDLMGKSSAKAATQLGQRNASQINSGYDSANAAAKTGYDTSTGRLSPYEQQGQKGFGAYNDALGINGDAARQSQFQTFESDPFMQYARQDSGNQVNALFRKYGAQGMANSGASGLAVSRAAGERAQGDVNNWLNRLQGLGNQGFQAAGALAGNDNAYYGGMADRAVGRSNALVGNDTQATMASNNARMSGINNLLSIGGGLLGAGARMYSGGGVGGGQSSAARNMVGNDLGGTYYR